MGHIELARWADAIVIAPATANFIAKLAAGQADDLATSICLATRKEILVAPAMNVQMWNNPATRKNIELLRTRAFQFHGPSAGELACGESGLGRMMDPETFISAVHGMLKKGIWQNKKVIVTAGPTIEPIDPVRFISNHSSGAMGYEIARRSVEVGADVLLISGPSAIPPPPDCEVSRVTTADEMFEETFKYINAKSIDIVFCVAAVCDYKPASYSNKKIKKQSESINFKLTKNKDILAEISNIKDRPFVIGFAAETNDLQTNGFQKLREKGCDVLAANDVSNKNLGFNSEYNELLVLSQKKQMLIEKAPKYEVAKQLIDFVHSEMNL